MQQTGSQFDRLVQELSHDERQAMLKRLAGILEQENEPVHGVEDDPVPVNLESEYRAFSMLQKLVVVLRTFFSPLTRVEVIEDTIMKGISRNLESRHPGLYDYTHGLLGKEFLEEIRTLNRGVKVFMVPVSRLGGQKREELFALIVNQEFPHLDARIRDACRPERFATEAEEGSEKELSRVIMSQLEDILDEINPEEKLKLTQDARSLHTLTELVYFPFDKIITKFAAAGKDNGCPAADLKEPLLQLTRIFFSMNQSPSPGLLEALFMVTRLEEEDTDPKDLFEGLGEELRQVREAIKRMRQFHQRVPLYDILRLINGKANIFMKPLSGGEEWLALFRAFWKKELKSTVRRYLIQQEYQRTRQEAGSLLEFSDLPSLPYYRQSVHPLPIKLAHIDSVAFLHHFIDRLFSLKLNPPLKQLLIDGEFYKEQNSEDFSESYNGLNLLNEAIQQLNDFLAPNGDGGRRLSAIAAEISSAAQREKRAALIAEEADEKALQHIQRGEELLNLLNSVLKGILYGEKGGRFDTLSNLGYIGGRSNEQFMQKLEECYHQIDTAHTLLEGMISLEQRYVRST